MKIEIYQHVNGEWAYRFCSKGRILFHSEGYDNKWNAERAVENLMMELKEFCSIDWRKKVNIEGS
jgi:uncharacterized protein YegP (UPF0339 family)